MSGYIKLYRDLKKWKWADCPSAVSLWIHILCGAYWEDGYYRGVQIKRGQYPTTTYKLAEEVGIHRHTVGAWLKRFESDNQITVNSYHKFSVITVINYDKFQSVEEKVVPQTVPQTVPPTIPQTVPQTVPPINLKEYKEDKEDKEYIYCGAESRAIAKQIIDHLNSKTGKQFRYSKTSLEPIIARLNEGYSLEDCIKVIDIKVDEWGRDSKMSQYLAPDTLFRASKFPRYLNQNPPKKTTNPFLEYVEKEISNNE